MKGAAERATVQPPSRWHHRLRVTVFRHYHLSSWHAYSLHVLIPWGVTDTRLERYVKRQLERHPKLLEGLPFERVRLSEEVWGEGGAGRMIVWTRLSMLVEEATKEDVPQLLFPGDVERTEEVAEGLLRMLRYHLLRLDILPTDWMTRVYRLPEETFVLACLGLPAENPLSLAVRGAMKRLLGDYQKEHPQWKVLHFYAPATHDVGFKAGSQALWLIVETRKRRHGFRRWLRRS